MSLRTRLLLAFAVVVLIPIALLAFGLRQEMTSRLSEEYQRRVGQVIETIREDLARESGAISERLASLESALVNDNGFRRAAVADVDSERDYLLDYAGTAMRLTGLSMLQIQDSDGRILSSGHFRNEHGRIEAGLVPALMTAGDVVLLATRSPEREFLALARAKSFVVGGRTFTIVGGVAVDDAFLRRLARDESIVVALRYPEGELTTRNVRLPSAALGAGKPDATRPDTTDDAAVGELALSLIQSESGASPKVVKATLEVIQPLTPLRALLRSADSWFLVTAAGAGITALVLAVWVSSRISRPLADLAEKTAVLDLDRLDVEFDAGHDEVGRLSRLLGELAVRLRTSTVRVREAERRATIGYLARQVNHDLKNGLIPLRNVMRHLVQVEREQPNALSAVFAERRSTLDSSLEYLESLSKSYQRLSPVAQGRSCDVNAIITDVVLASTGHHDRPEYVTHLATVPPIVGDPIEIRRILENLLSNARDSLESNVGRITVSTSLVSRTGDSPVVRMTVADNGRGMSEDEVSRVFEDFYTTKKDGTGLGLSIVRRLVMDLHGTIAVESKPGLGTRFIIDIPAGPTRT